MALYCWRRNSFEGCCHALPWSSWSPLLSSWCCPCCASPLPFSLVIRSPYLNIIRVSNAGKDVNKIINPKSWLLPPLLAREQWRNLLSTRGASTRVTKPGKVNELFDRNPGKKGSQWAQWTTLMGKEMQWPILIAEMPCRSLQSWADIKERVREAGAGASSWRACDIPPLASSTQSHRAFLHQGFTCL